MLALLEPGDEVVLPDPVYVGLVNRVLLAGGVPRFVPCEIVDGVWRLDRDAVAGAVGPRTRAFLMMSPTMPSGCVFDRADWETVCAACVEAGAWMVYDAAMERILFDGAEPLHPAGFPGMAERSITVGSVSKEQRMIGWRVGSIVAPPEIVPDLKLVSISNTCTNVGIAQAAAAVALRAPDSDVAAATAEWQRRRDAILAELDGWPVVRPEGGWSLLVDVARLGMTGTEASARLFERSKVAATPMTGWGSERSAGYLRLVYSNEPGCARSSSARSAEPGRAPPPGRRGRRRRRAPNGRGGPELRARRAARPASRRRRSRSGSPRGSPRGRRRGPVRGRRRRRRASGGWTGGGGSW